MPRLQPRLAAVSVFLMLTLGLTRFDAESYGDTLQASLPLAGLGCAAASGNLPSYPSRYVSMWLTVFTTKRALGDSPINRRPAGGNQGFPSAHTASAVFGASNLVHACLDNAPLFKTAIVVAAAYTGASRIEAGRHGIWQVLAGAILAILFERGFAEALGCVSASKGCRVDIACLRLNRRQLNRQKRPRYQKTGIRCRNRVRTATSSTGRASRCRAICGSAGPLCEDGARWN